MWRELWQWLKRRLTGRATVPGPDAPPAVPEAPPAAASPGPAAPPPEPEDQPWPFGHHVPPDVEAEAEQHRGEWRS